LPEISKTLHGEAALREVGFNCRVNLARGKVVAAIPIEAVRACFINEHINLAVSLTSAQDELCAYAV